MSIIATPTTITGSWRTSNSQIQLSAPLLVLQTSQRQMPQLASLPVCQILVNGTTITQSPTWNLRSHLWLLLYFCIQQVTESVNSPYSFFYPPLLFLLPTPCHSYFENESQVANPTLCDPMDCSLQRFSVHGIFQARILEWSAISFSRGSSQPRDRTWVSRIVGRCFTIWAIREVPFLL